MIRQPGWEGHWLVLAAVIGSLLPATIGQCEEETAPRVLERLRSQQHYDGKRIRELVEKARGLKG
jgi:hypothetical protein